MRTRRGFVGACGTCLGLWVGIGRQPAPGTWGTLGRCSM
ncbi:twin-arginine translocation signal domain-containing protein [Streptomyces sp. NPDC051132]